MITKEKGLEIVKLLVDRFEEQLPSYTKSEYNETLTRRDFIDPFFKALGWDVDNSQGYAEAYREVIHEDKIKIEGATKAPDYSFRLPGGKRLFFVEAKKPSVSVKNEIMPAYQIRRYSWSAELPISIITDFEEFAVYDCTKKPVPSDKPSVGRIKYLTFRDYVNEFDFIWDIFSKERVLKGSFDKFVFGDSYKKGTTAVDKDFLTSLNEWRAAIANDINRKNKWLDQDELNYLVQQAIDRLIFLRIAEDRNIEPYGRLRESVKHGNYYKNLFGIFEEADAKYNSGLFDFKKDKISGKIEVDNKVVKSIINELYYPNSPYEFSVIPVEILGSAYEQFLGQQIELTSNHKIQIEDKPLVRKAGGVYYTPQYIVDFIIEQVVGPLVKGKTPAEIGNIKILDPACGSGSFLLGAYGYLLKWYKDYYTNSGKTVKTKSKLLTPEGNLTTAEKSRILLTHIYGVDIDSNATEVTKLSLLLKCMEGETKASIAYQFAMFHERVLPSLENNVKTGNSVIDIDIYDGELEFDEEKRVRPFNWERAFPDVFAKGGFDAVIGNPPYVRSKLLEAIERRYFAGKYGSARGTFDLYGIFIERAFQLLKDGGLVGFINPNKYFYSDYGAGLREFVTANYRLERVFDFNEFQVFDRITTYTAVNIFSKLNGNNKFRYDKVLNKSADRHEVKEALLQDVQIHGIETYPVSSKSLGITPWIFKAKAESGFIERIRASSVPLSSLCYKIYQGFVLTPTEVFPVSIEKVLKDSFEIKPVKKDENSYLIEKNIVVPIIKSSSIFKYKYEQKNYYSLFPYRYIDEKTVELIGERELKTQFPKAFQYLKAKSGYLKTREKGKWAKSPNWYEYSRKQNFECQKMEKIIVPGLATEARYTLAGGDVFIDQGSYGIILLDQYKDLEKFILGLLNSKLIDFIFKAGAGTLSGGYYSYQSKYLASIPIKIPKGKEREIVADISENVDELLKLAQQIKKATTEKESTRLNDKIYYYENKIDKVVFKLYGMTEKEVSLVLKQ
jgi:adenine-specific DNA-methyltransferase